MKKSLSLMLATVMLAMTLVGCAVNDGGAAGNGSGNVETWPTTKNVELICPGSAGSTMDIVARALANHLEGQFDGVTFSVTNDSSGGQTVAFEMGRTADPDGSRLLLGTATMIFSYNYGIYDHLVTDPEEFTIIDDICFDQDQGVIVVRSDSPYETLDDLVNAAKEKPNTLTVGCGSGNIVYAQAVTIEHALGCTFRKVDGNDQSERITNLLGGFNDWAYIGAATALQYEESGDMRILAICQNDKSSVYPEIPTLADLGYPMEKMIKQNYILCTTPNMPAEMAQVISDAIDGFENNAMLQQAFETALKGSTYTSVDRETAIAQVQELQDICVELGIHAN